MAEDVDKLRYDIGQLAEVSGQSVRNLRAYLQTGVLHPGTKRGRSLMFGDEHVARLEAVVRLQKRGYSLAAIRDVLSGDDQELIADDVKAIARLVERWLDEEAAPVPGLEDLSLLVARRALPTPIDVDQIEAQVDQLRSRGMDLARPELMQAILDISANGVPLHETLGEIEEFGARLEPVVDYLGEVAIRWSKGGPPDPERLRQVWPSLLLAISSHLTERFFAAAAGRSADPAAVPSVTSVSAGS